MKYYITNAKALIRISRKSGLIIYNDLSTIELDRGYFSPSMGSTIKEISRKEYHRLLRQREIFCSSLGKIK